MIRRRPHNIKVNLVAVTFGEDKISSHEEGKMNLLRFLVLVVIAHTSASALADTAIYPTLPGTNIRDYSRPGYIEQGKDIYPTLPGTNIRDYSEPGYTRQGDTMYQTLPGTNIRDYSKPGYEIEHGGRGY